MSQNPSDQQPTVTTGTRGGRRIGPLPIWAWVLLAIVLVLVVLAILQSCAGGARDAGPSATPAETTASATPTPSASITASPTATAGGDVGQGTFASEMDGYLSDVLNSQNTAVLSEGGTFSDPVFVLTADGTPGEHLTPDAAVDAMAGMFTPVDPDPWDLALPESTLDDYRAGPYGDYFPVGAIVARSHDGHVFSFIGHDFTITTMLMAASEDQLL